MNILEHIEAERADFRSKHGGEEPRHIYLGRQESEELRALAAVLPFREEGPALFGDGSWGRYRGAGLYLISTNQPHLTCA